MKRMILMLVLAAMGIAAEAQFGGSIIIGRPYGYGGYGRARGYYRPRQQQPNLPPFQPSLNVSFGYGFPNLDKQYFASFYNLYKGNATNQVGPFSGAIDYQFSRFMSIGVMGTYGKVSQPYYSFNNSSNAPYLTGKFENWSLLLNVISYFPTYNRAVSPYLRTAIGFNNWTQAYTDASGGKTNGIEEPPALAYQVSLGAKFNLTPRAGIFLEAGYGKYIASGGLSFKF